MSKNTNVFISLILAVAFLVAVQIKADTITWDWTPAKADGLTESVTNVSKGFSLTAQENTEGTGVTFTFTNTSRKPKGGKGDNDGYGKIKDNLYFYNVTNISNIFENISDDGFTSWSNGGYLNQLEAKSADGYPLNKKMSADFNISANGYSAKEGDQFGSLEFTLKYANPDSGWETFFDDVDNWIIAMDFQAMDAKPDSFPFYTVMSGPSEGSGNTTPEPATLAVLGLGLTGLGWASRRRRK